MVQRPEPSTRSERPSSSHGPSTSMVTGSPDPLDAVSSITRASTVVGSSGASSMACRPRSTGTVVLTGGAGAQSASPGCLAVMVQSPARTASSTPSSRRQAPAASIRTGSPESAAALTTMGSPTLAPATGRRSTVWRPRATRSVVATGAAGAQSASPGWEAVTVQRPAPSATSMPSATRHGPATSIATGRPELASALIATGSAPRTVSGSGRRSIVWMPSMDSV